MPADTRDVEEHQPQPGSAAQGQAGNERAPALAELEGLVTGAASAGDAGVGEEDVDDIEELDDIEDLEELDPEDEEDVAAPARPAAPVASGSPRVPSRPGTPPPVPPRFATRPPAPPPPAPRAPVPGAPAPRAPTLGAPTPRAPARADGPMPVPASASGPVPAPGVDPLVDRSGPEAMPAAAPAPAVPAPPPLEMASPTALDLALDGQGMPAWAARAQALQARLDAAPADAREAESVLAYELGALRERYLGDEPGALAAYERAFQADPSLRANLWALARLLPRQGRWQELIELIDAEARYARDDQELAELCIEKGHILETRLNEPAQAREAYEHAAALSPGAAGAFHGIERLALAAGDEDALVRAYAALAEGAGEPARKLMYLLDLARLHAERGELIDAQEVLVRAAALDVDPDRVTRAQVRVAELTGDPQELLEALDARAAHLARPQVVAVRRRQAQVARDQLGDLEMAWSYLQQALALAPGEPLILADLADAAEQLGRYEELAALCQGWESLQGEQARSLSLSLRRADALLRGGQREQAHVLLDSLAQVAPGYLPITALRERDALIAQDWALLARAYEEAGEAARRGTWFGPDAGGPDVGEPDVGEPDALGAGGLGPAGASPDPAAGASPDPAAAAAFLVSAGDLHDWMLGDEDEARRCYARALDAMPGYGPAFEALCALEERTGRLAEAAALLEARSEQGARDERAHLLERLARIYWDLGRLEDVLDAEQRLLALDPEGPESVRMRWRIEGTLAELGRAAERAALLVALAGELAGHADVSARRGVALLTAARIYDEELGDAAQAEALYRQVLELWPGDRHARAARIALLRRGARWEELVAERRAEVGELADGPALARALREAADLLRHELGRPAEAAELYRELLDRIPGHPAALRGLAEVLAELGQHDELFDTLELESVTHESAAAQCEATLRLGRALERSGRREEALDAYRRAMEMMPGSALAAVAVAELADQDDDPGQRAEALVSLAESRSDPGLESELLEDAGWLWTLEAEDRGRGIDALERAAAVAASPEAGVDAGPGAYLGLALLHAGRGDLREAGEALARLAETASAPAVKSALLLRATAIAETDEDPALVRERLQRAVAAAPDDTGTAVVAAEHALAAGLEGTRVPSADELLAQADLFGMRAALAGSPAARDDWELEQADALEAAGRLRDAARIVAAVLDTNPGDLRALQTLRRICRRGGDRAGLARASVALARVLTDAEGKVQLLREAALILDRELGDPAGAVPVYRRILAEDPGAAEYDRVMEICREHGDVRALVELLGNRLNWLDLLVRIDPHAARAQVSLLLERAALRQALGDARGAGRDLARVLDIDPRHVRALGVRARIAADLGDAGVAAELLQRYLEVETEPERRAQAELDLSRILAEDMDDVAGAIEQLDQVLQRTPDDIEVRERLVNLLGRGEAWPRMVEELRELARRRQAAGQRAGDSARDHVRIAGVLRDRLGDRDRAAAALEQALELDPVHLDAVRELADLLADRSERRQQVLRKAARDLRRAIAESPDQAGLYERLAVIAGWQGTREARYYALCAMELLGSLSAEQEGFVAETGAALAALPLSEVALSTEEWSKRLSAVNEPGTHLASDVWQLMAEAVTRTLGLEPGKLGFGRGERVAHKNLDRRYQALSRAASCFGVEAAELYIAETRPGYARVLSLDGPVVCLGGDVARGEGATARFLLGRALAQARMGTGSLGELREDEMLLFFAAAVQVAGAAAMPDALAQVAAADAGGVDERARSLSKHMARRDRRQLGRLADRLGGMEPAAWRRAALGTATRAGLLLAGDLRGPVDVLDMGRAGRAPTGDRAALDLLVWMVGEDHVWLRRHLGLSLAP